MEEIKKKYTEAQKRAIYKYREKHKEKINAGRSIRYGRTR
jgi:hypothetical protein